MEAGTKVWICSFRPRERAWDRKECSYKECQGERDARGRTKAEQTLVQGKKEFCLQNRVGTGIALTYSPSL